MHICAKWFKLNLSLHYQALPGVPASGQRVPTAILNGVPIYSENEVSPGLCVCVCIHIYTEWYLRSYLYAHKLTYTLMHQTWSFRRQTFASHSSVCMYTLKLTQTYAPNRILLAANSHKPFVPPLDLPARTPATAYNTLMARQLRHHGLLDAGLPGLTRHMLEAAWGVRVGVVASWTGWCANKCVVFGKQ